mmetsp:Transcript_56059/g.119236  ORF Transcript_56059/g.119236 Transcript_56059/m.119236 type:complete len:107 (-) Transcript_56059:162-482(-)
MDLNGGRLNGSSFHDLRSGFSESGETQAASSVAGAVETESPTVDEAPAENLEARKNAGRCRWEDVWNALAVRSWNARLVLHLQLLRATMVKEEGGRVKQDSELPRS